MCRKGRYCNSEQPGPDRADDEPGQAAYAGQNHGLSNEQGKDLSSVGSDRPQKADFCGPLTNGNCHDRENPYAAHHKGDTAQRADS